MSSSASISSDYSGRHQQINPSSPRRLIYALNRGCGRGELKAGQCQPWTRHQQCGDPIRYPAETPAQILHHSRVRGHHVALPLDHKLERQYILTVTGSDGTPPDTASVC
ncbi:cadherin EGF LAG seven-pass G-type receptor 1-like protein [Lates japonicus]|uniref:Cadherin EGF LAG seven-pass G-type receptor 1-like protein n=1 Tax=Lates japonicus TaxID=270547 RepID=A0AAD3RBL0_LATJO|nr:cadherin EGF LAG seven-pass G-type receptor 1-like protein [Lates japonicus]